MNNNFNKMNLVKKTIVFLTILLLICSFLIFCFHIFNGLNKNLNNYNTESLDLIDQRMQAVLSDINSFPRTASDDLLFASRSPCLEKLINFDSSSGLALKNYTDLIETNFLEFLKTSDAYYQLFYVDENGNEVIKTKFDGKNYELVSKDKLQNRKDEYYFSKTMNLDKEEIFISHLELNIINGVLENRGTEKNPEYVPVIRYGIPIFSDKEEQKGVIILDILADYFLDDIRNFQREGELSFLINNNGYYLAHPNKTKEFAFMFPDEDTSFLNDYPEVFDLIMVNQYNRRVETDSSIFTYRYIYPLTGSFEIYEGSKKRLENGYYWILITITDKNDIQKTYKDFRSEYLWNILPYGITTLIAIILIYLLVKKNKYEK